MPALQLYLLGTLDIRSDDRPLPKPPTLKSQSLLAYLILHRRQPQPRDRLVGLFWGDRPERKARRSLTTALWHIRRCLPQDYILSDPYTVQFDPQADLWLDVDEFEFHLSHDEMAHLQSAMALYRGHFLDGFYDDWIINERYRLEALFCEALARLMVAQEARGEYDTALSTALRLLDRDPFREDAHRLAMRAYCWLGRRNAALEQYRRCQEILREELGAEPTVETAELHQAILEGRLAVGRAPEVHPVQVAAIGERVSPPLPSGRSPLDVMVPSRLVGREEELAFLHQCWQGVSVGSDRLILISGEAGVGKTRLVQEFADRLRWQGVRVLWGRCYEFERALPYQPIAEALRTVLPTLEPAEPVDLPPRAVAQVARLVPEIAEHYPDLEAPASTPSDQEQAHLFDSMAHFLAKLSSQGAILIVLEDLHWASESTLQLVHYLTRHLTSGQALVVGTLRPEAVGQRHPLRVLQRQLSREGLCQLLRLPRLSPAGVEALVVEMSGAGEAAVPLAGRLYQETEGNPFFLMEIVKALFEAGVVHLEGGAWQGDFALLSRAEIPLPAGVSEAIRGRVNRLSDDTREAVRLAAVLGREFDFDLLNAVWGRGEEATLEALDDLLRQQLTDEGSGAMGRDYIFTHHKIQEVIYAGMPRRRRQYIHGQVGAAMETLYGPQTEEVVGELAFHFEQGQQLDKTLTEKAIHYLHQAGDQAVRLAANQEAITHFARGLELLETLPDTPEHVEQELALQLALGASLMATKGYGAPEVGRAYHRARELCQQIGETPQLFWTLQPLVAFYGVRGDLQTAIEVAEQNLRVAERTQDPAKIMFAHWALGVQLLFVGEFARALDYLKRVIDFYDPEKHRSLVFKFGMDAGTYCLNWAAYALWYLGYPDQALKRSQEALALAQQLEHPFNLAFALCNSGVLFNVLRRELPAARDHVEPLIRLSATEGFLFYRAWGTFLWGWFLAEEEQAEEGLAQMRQGLAASQATGAELELTLLLAMLAEACAKMGQIEEGLNVLSEALAQVEKSRERWWEAEIYRLKGELLLMQAQAQAEEEACFRDAETCFRRAIEVARQQQAKSWELRATASLCRLWQKQGKDGEARQMLAEIYGWFSEGFDTPDLKEAEALLKALS